MSSSLAQPTGQTIQRESFERDAHVCPHPFTVTNRASSVLPGGRSGTVFCFVIACSIVPWPSKAVDRLRHHCNSVYKWVVSVYAGLTNSADTVHATLP